MKLSGTFINHSIKILLTFLFFINIAAAFYLPFFSIFVTEHIVEATLATVGLAGAIYSIVRSIVQIPIARFLDKQPGESYDFYFLLVGAISGICYSFGFIFIKSIPQLYILESICGIGDAFMMASYYVIFAHHIDKKSEGVEWSMLNVVSLTIALAIGSAVGGFVAQYYGFRTLFIGAGMLNIVATILLIALYPYIKTFRTKRRIASKRVTKVKKIVEA